MEYSIKRFDRRTELSFSQEIDIELIKTMLKDAKVNVNVTCLEFGRYRVNKRLDNNQKSKLNKVIRKQFGLKEPEKIIPVKVEKVNVKTDTINGYKGCPITGYEFEFLYC